MTQNRKSTSCGERYDGLHARPARKPAFNAQRLHVVFLLGSRCKTLRSFKTSDVRERVQAIYVRLECGSRATELSASHRFVSACPMCERSNLRGEAGSLSWFAATNRARGLSAQKRG